MQIYASKLRDEMHLTHKMPVSIHQILKEKEILAVMRPMSPDFSGMAIRTMNNEHGSNHLFMLINTGNVLGRQRFTACHELYHLLFQKDFKMSINNAGKFNESDTEEFKADCFASFLILPDDGLRLMVPTDEQEKDRITLSTILKIEQNYRCSRSTVLKRLKDLKWITSATYEKYNVNIQKGAAEYGYSCELYKPTNRQEIVSDYNIKARKLYDMAMISQAKYYSLLFDIDIEPSSITEEYGEE